jgi:hypothetical protein
MENYMEFKEISDLYLVSALISLGYSPQGKHKDGKRVIFTFESDEAFKKLCEDFDNNKLWVDAKSLGLNIKAVKSSIYNMEE